MLVWIHYNERTQPWCNEWKQAFAEGVRAHGDSVRYGLSPEYDDDLAVVWAYRTGQQRIGDTMRSRGKRLLVMERGYIGDRESWTSLGFDGLNGRAEFPRAGLNTGRFKRLFGHLLKPWKSGGEYIVILGQVEGDASLGGRNLQSWYQEAAAKASAMLGLKAFFRPHPLGPSKERRGEREIVQGLRTLPGTLDEALDGAAAAVTFNSNSGVDAVLAGVPTWTVDRGSMAWAVTGHALDKPPPRPARELWADWLAGCQWSMDEMRSGQAWSALRPLVQLEPAARRATRG